MVQAHNIYMSTCLIIITIWFLRCNLKQYAFFEKMNQLKINIWHKKHPHGLLGASSSAPPSKMYSLWDKSTSIVKQSEHFRLYMLKKYNCNREMRCKDDILKTWAFCTMLNKGISVYESSLISTVYPIYAFFFFFLSAFINFGLLSSFGFARKVWSLQHIWFSIYHYNKFYILLQ